MWKILIGIAAAAALWFGGQAVSSLWIYARLSQRVPAAIATWEIQELSPSKFAFRAIYTYTVGEKSYEGKTLFESFHALNRYAAESEIQQLKKERWSVWYAPRNASRSSLERKMPYKQLIYTFMCLGILFYFGFAQRLSKAQ